MKTRVISMLTASAMLLTLLPAALAEEIPQEQCSCVSPCTGGETNTECPACGAAGAALSAVCKASVPDPASTPAVEGNSIYANGTAIEVAAGTTADYTNIRYDANGDGAIGETEYLKIDGAEPTDAGYDLSAYSVYGGGKDSEAASTDVTMSGGKVFSVYGGGYNGAVTGGAKVALPGGEVSDRVYGGGRKEAATVGSTEVAVSDGGAAKDVFGGGYSGVVTGTAVVTVTEGGTVSGRVYGGGCMAGATVDSASVTVTNGAVGSIYGGGDRGAVTGTATVTVADGAVKFSVYGGGYYEEATVGGDTEVTISGGQIGYNVCGGGFLAKGSGSVALTIGGGAKIGHENEDGEAAGVVINGENPPDDEDITNNVTNNVTNSVTAFAIDPDLAGGAGCIFVVLPASAKAGDIIATGAVESDVAKLKLAGAGAADKMAYLDGTDIKLRNYIVTFDSQGGSAVESGIVTGGRAAKPADPTRSGYTFAGWYREADCTNVWDFAADAATGDTTLYAKWRRRSSGNMDSYTVTATAGAGGGISPSGSVSVAQKGSKTFTVKPDDGFEIADVLVDGKSVGAVESYTFKEVENAHTIAASFRKKTEEAARNPFTDVRTDDWFYDSVMYVYEHDLMTGVSDTAFSPESSMQRGMIATILWRMEGQPETENGRTFADVADGDFCAKAIRWTDANGIAIGYGNGNFGPTDAVTREQIAAILYRYAHFKGVETSAVGDLAGFSDQPYRWAEDAVQWAVGVGTISGKGGGILDPHGDATRAEAAVVLVRYDKIDK